LYNKYKAENPDVSSWNAPDIIEVYQKGIQVSGISDNFEWKPLVMNLQPLLNKAGNVGEDEEVTPDTSTETDSAGVQEGETILPSEDSSTQEEATEEE
jgi:hypothetical protein